jgi:HAE1 family hydrophobic/amphiphilic exporter-1
MSLGLGAGADMQAPMSRTVIGGLCVASLFTLFFIPTLYSLFDSAKVRIRKVEEQ